MMCENHHSPLPYKYGSWVYFLVALLVFEGKLYQNLEREEKKNIEEMGRRLDLENKFGSYYKPSVSLEMRFLISSSWFHFLEIIFSPFFMYLLILEMVIIWVVYIEKSMAWFWVSSLHFWILLSFSSFWSLWVFNIC